MYVCTTQRIRMYILYVNIILDCTKAQFGYICTYMNCTSKWTQTEAYKMLQLSTHQSSDISDGFVVLVTQLFHAPKAAVGNTHACMQVRTHASLGTHMHACTHASLGTHMHACTHASLGRHTYACMWE